MKVFDKNGSEIDIVTSNTIRSELILIDDYFDSIDINNVYIFDSIMQINFRGRLKKDIPGGGVPILQFPNGYTAQETQLVPSAYYGQEYLITNNLFAYYDQIYVKSQDVLSGNYIHLNGSICFLKK